MCLVQINSDRENNKFNGKRGKLIRRVNPELYVVECDDAFHLFKSDELERVEE